MARKRKEKSEEEDIGFKIPKFNEEEFVKREKRNIKTLYISFLFALLIALISVGFWILMADSYLRWELVMLFGVINMVFLKYLFEKLNIDLSDFGRKGWFGSFAVYLLTWLLVFIILINPPIYDEDEPFIELIVLPGMQEAGGTVLIVANIIDNAGIDVDSITLDITYPDGTTDTPAFAFEDSILTYSYENTEQLMGTYNFTITVSDVNNHQAQIQDSFIYTNDTLSITSSRFTDIRSRDAIAISAQPELCEINFRVYYTINDGPEINVDREERVDKQNYETTAEYEGWNENSNHTIRVYAETLYYFLNHPTKYNNTVSDTTVYQFSTGSDANIGTEPPLASFNCTLAALRQSQKENTINYSLPCPVSVQGTPGFEIAVFLISLLVAIILFKKSKRTPKK